MSNTSKALIWAAIIIAAALVMSGMDVSGAASTGVILGLSGAALGTIKSGGRCRRGCAQ